MAYGVGGGDSTQTTRKTTVNQDINASGQAVVSAPRHTGNNAGNTSYTAKGNGRVDITTLVQGGLDPAQIQKISEALLSNAPGTSQTDPFQQSLLDRLKDNIAEGAPSVANKLGVGNIVLIVAGLVALVVVGVFLRKKKKG